MNPLREERRRLLAEAAGVIECRLSPQTGRLVTLYDGIPAGLDTDGGRWSTVCEAHGWIVAHRTLALAQSHLADPRGWCEECMKDPEPKSAIPQRS